MLSLSRHVTISTIFYITVSSTPPKTNWFQAIGGCSCGAEETVRQRANAQPALNNSAQRGPPYLPVVCPVTGGVRAGGPVLFPSKQFLLKRSIIMGSQKPRKAYYSWKLLPNRPAARNAYSCGYLSEMFSISMIVVDAHSGKSPMPSSDAVRPPRRRRHHSTSLLRTQYFDITGALGFWTREAVRNSTIYGPLPRPTQMVIGNVQSCCNQARPLATPAPQQYNTILLHHDQVYSCISHWCFKAIEGPVVKRAHIVPRRSLIRIQMTLGLPRNASAIRGDIQHDPGRYRWQCDRYTLTSCSICCRAKLTETFTLEAAMSCSHLLMCHFTPRANTILARVRIGKDLANMHTAMGCPPVGKKIWYRRPEAPLSSKLVYSDDGCFIHVTNLESSVASSVLLLNSRATMHELRLHYILDPKKEKLLCLRRRHIPTILRPCSKVALFTISSQEEHRAVIPKQQFKGHFPPWRLRKPRKGSPYAYNVAHGSSGRSSQTFEFTWRMANMNAFYAFPTCLAIPIATDRFFSRSTAPGTGNNNLAEYIRFKQRFTYRNYGMPQIRTHLPNRSNEFVLPDLCGCSLSDFDQFLALRRRARYRTLPYVDLDNVVLEKAEGDDLTEDMEDREDSANV
ncbi:uncharacterized protein BDR25DRAFT_353686 [Lindgomyces ingoldianus]|uniref:Uncharacterized protein n=1 Tax=Lindgomyces ingoldianus TaxID=673940 RepID=A0ACB6R0D4_9PLEO|nr:uncharacterized protein BDR25DRAFT_353686 [Lindgomyces ingoldianus]KAF2471906.1 hypothetical protein BDR25DRAFT_353686 [Lindgomyces ingoldianus]